MQEYFVVYYCPDDCPKPERKLTLAVSIGCLGTDELEAFKRITKFDNAGNCYEIVSNEYFNGLSLDGRLDFNEARKKYKGAKPFRNELFEDGHFRYISPSRDWANSFHALSFLPMCVVYADRIRAARIDKPIIGGTVAQEAAIDGAGAVKAEPEARNPSINEKRDKRLYELSFDTSYSWADIAAIINKELGEQTDAKSAAEAAKRYYEKHKDEGLKEIPKRPRGRKPNPKQ